MKHGKRMHGFLAFAAAFASAQGWETSFQGTTTSITSAFMPLMVGDANSIYAESQQSKNAGASWTHVPMLSGRNYFSVGQFVNPTNGIVLGNTGPSGTLFSVRTTNSGLSWRFKTISGYTSFPAGLHFFSIDTGYALTTTGAVLKTTDSGNTWQELTSLGVPGRGLFFTNPQTGYALGNGHFVYRTTNGGAAWTAVPVSATGQLRALHFPTATTGYAVGDSGNILKSTDAGASWNVLSQGTHPDLLDVRFLDTATGYAVGSAGTVLKTTNGGAAWNLQTSGTTRTIRSVRFSEAGVAFAVADSGLILRSGISSGTIFPPTGLTYPRASLATYVVGSAAGDTPSVAGTTPTFTINPSLPPGLSLNNSNGIISGTPEATATPGPQDYVVTASNAAGSSKDTVRITITFTPPSGLRYWYPNPRTWAVGVPVLENTAFVSGHGVTFSSTPVLPSGIMLNPATGSITGVPTVVSPQTIYTVRATNPGGSDSLTLNYGVGTTAWDSLVTGVPEQTLHSLFFTDSLRGFAGGQGSILKTTNAGNSWQGVPSGSQQVYAIRFASQSVGYGVGSTLLKTVDSGATWTSEALPGSGTAPGLPTIHLATGGAIYIGTRASILKTTNSGATWTLYNTPVTPAGIRFTTPEKGHALGRDGTVFRTNDGGGTWISSPSNVSAILASAYLADSNTWIAVGTGGTIVRTTNGGSSWTAAGGVTNKNLHAVTFLDAMTGWAVGDTGVILQTLNGGLTWSQMVTGRVIPFHAITAAPGGKRYVAGAGGVILVNDSMAVTRLSVPGIMRTPDLTANFRGDDLVLSYALVSPSPVRIRLLDTRGRVWKDILLPREPEGRRTLTLSLETMGRGFHLLEFTTDAGSRSVKIAPRL